MPLEDFTLSTLSAFESTPRTRASDEWRIAIPRVLFSMRHIRNARGDMHETPISSNHIDSEYMYSCIKWLLCEIIRLSGNGKQSDIVEVIETIETRNTLMVWSGGTIKRVLCPKLSCREQVLVLLYAHHKAQLADELLLETEYASKSRFRNTILKEMHRRRLIEYDGTKCEILPPGVIEAEKIINKWTMENGR